MQFCKSCRECTVSCTQGKIWHPHFRASAAAAAAALMRVDMCHQGNDVMLQGVWCTMEPGNRWCPSLNALASRFPSAREWLISFRRSALRKIKRYADSKQQIGCNKSSVNTANGNSKLIDFCS